MGKLRSAMCLVGLLLLIPALFQARRILPLDTRPLVAEKYAGWTGVLTLWIHEGWPSGSGSIAPWLNHCIKAFEKAHPGVYVQPQYVDAGAVAGVHESGILPPDMLLFPPNLLATPEGLIPLTSLPSIRTALTHCGDWNGRTCAVPVAIGGYLWAWNADLIDAIPDSWRGADVRLSVPAPEPWRRWDAVLLALCSGRYTPPEAGLSPASTPPTAFEMELGLAGDETPVPTSSPEPSQRGMLSRHLPDGFQYDVDAWRHFINGEVAAMPVTQREVRRLQALSDQGRGPNWKLCPGDSAFTDQLLCLAIVDKPGETSKQALCTDFIAWLLSDECQGMLCHASAFAVTDVASGYDASDPLAIMDAALRSPGLCAPRIFDRHWTEQAEDIVREFISDTRDAPVLWHQLQEYLAKKTND